MKTIIVSNETPELEEILKTEIPEIQVVFIPEEREVVNQIKDATVLIPERYKVDKKVLEAAPNLKLIHCGTGFNNVDIEEARKRNIFVATTPGVVAQSVAEHVFSLIHQIYKKTSELDSSMKDGRWEREAFRPYFELAGKTLGLLGFGDIGKRVSRIAKGYDMQVLVNRRKQTDENFDVELVDLDRLYHASDIVSVHIPLTEGTKKLIGNKEFDKMQNTAYFINTSRGAIVDEVALVTALEEGKIAGAGIDVYVEEPLSKDSLLRRAQNIVLTPHTAYYTEEALGRRFRAYAKNIKRLTTEESLENLV